MTKQKEFESWKLLNIFQNKVRLEIIRLLLRLEWRSLSDIARKLDDKFGWKMSLPGLLKHMRELEDAGIVRHESGIYAEKPDARKTIYILEGKERVQKILNQLEHNVIQPLIAGVTFNQTAKLARKLQGMGQRSTREERERFKSLIAKCESKEVSMDLTEDEKKKLKIWKIMLAMEE